MMRIQKGSVVLRPWADDDVEMLAHIANNKKIYDNLRDGFPHPFTLEHAKQFIAGAKQPNELSRLFAIEVDGRLAGSIGAFFKQDIYRKNAEIAYYIGEEFWGKGIMTTVISALIEYLFDNHDILRIYAEPFARNTGSCRALEKAGFRLEAVLKSNIVKNGTIEDSCIYSILKVPDKGA